MRALFIALLCISLAACAVNPRVKADNPHPEHDEMIARDAARQLAKLYPPAKTQFNLVESNSAGFGARLAEKLRAKGYAVTEAAPQKTGIRAFFQNDGFGAAYPPKPAPDANKQALPPADPAPGIALRYVLDHSGTMDFSRITLKIGASLLARAYVNDNGAIAPAGAWTFKE